MTKNLMNEENAYQQFFEEVSKGIKSLRKDKEYTLREIISDEYWKTVNNQQKRKYGVVFYQVHNTEDFGLKFVEKNNSNSNLYCLAD